MLGTQSQDVITHTSCGMQKKGNIRLGLQEEIVQVLSMRLGIQHQESRR